VLNQVIHYLECLGIDTLAPDELLPDYFRESRQEILKQQANILYAKCKSKLLNPELSAILMDFFYSCCDLENFTQQALVYAEQLISALLKLISKQAEGAAELPLMDKLLRMNFNSVAFYKFYASYITDKLEEQAGTKRKLMALNHHYKALKQTLVHPGMALEPKRKDLQALLLDYIEAEISYHERVLEDERYQQLAGSGQQSAPNPELEQSGNKIQLQFSQRILAIWSQTMISLNLISLGLGGQKDFTNFLVNNFRTRGQETIHAEYIRRRYKEKHSAASETLIHILEEMIRFIKQEYIGINTAQKK
jgi:hypothetical protein